MAKSKTLDPKAAPDSDEWQTRDDVNNLMRADEVHQDPKRHGRAIERMRSTVDRFSKRKVGRTSGRSGSR